MHAFFTHAWHIYVDALVNMLTSTISRPIILRLIRHIDDVFGALLMSSFCHRSAC